MERRNVLYGAATMLAGAALPSIGNEPSARPQPRNSLARPARFPYLETGERTSLFCKDWGSSERVVVFVHGWPFHSDMWQYQMFHLASAGVRTIAYDQRGCGRSSDPGTGYDFDTLADDLAAVIEQLGLQKVILVGHSIGTGQIVRYLSRHGAGRVTRIVLLSASLPYIQKSADNRPGAALRFCQVFGNSAARVPKALCHECDQEIRWGHRDLRSHGHVCSDRCRQSEPE